MSAQRIPEPFSFHHAEQLIEAMRYAHPDDRVAIQRMIGDHWCPHCGQPQEQPRRCQCQNDE